MRIPRLVAVAIVASLVCPIGFASAKQNNPVCQGIVRGLSNDYDPATGSGFLAVRAGPTTQASQIGELFNGMHVAIYGHNGNWLRIFSRNLGQYGWVYARYVSDNCPW